MNKKFQQASGEMQSNFMQKLVAEARPLIEPKLQALEQKVRAALGAPAAAARTGRQLGAAPKAAAKPPAKAREQVDERRRPTAPTPRCWRCARRSTPSTASCWRC